MQTTATGFDITPSANAGSTFVYYLAVELADPADAWVGTVDAATSAGAAANTGPGFEPTALLLAGSMNAAVNSFDDAGGVFVGATDCVRSRAIGGWVEDGITIANPPVSVAQSVSADKVVQIYSHDGVIEAEAGISSFDATGFTLDYTDAASSAWKWLGLAIKGSQLYGKPVTVTVPDVTGLSQADAEAALIAEGLVLGTVTEATSNVVAAGLVISQDPEAGAIASPGFAVGIVVSLGPVRGGGSDKRRRKERKHQLPPQHHVDPERARIYARAGTELLPAKAQPPALEVVELEPDAPEQVSSRIQALEQAGEDAAAAIAAEQAVLGFLEAQDAEQARTRLAQLEQEALLAYLMVV